MVNGYLNLTSVLIALVEMTVYPRNLFIYSRTKRTIIVSTTPLEKVHYINLILWDTHAPSPLIR